MNIYEQSSEKLAVHYGHFFVIKKRGIRPLPKLIAAWILHADQSTIMGISPCDLFRRLTSIDL